MPRRLVSRALMVLLAIALSLIFEPPTVAQAQSRVAYLAERLKYPPPSGMPDDFRVRTNAALALGQTNDDAAVQPLCGGLSDPSDVVRQAVASAHKRLGRQASLGCLKARKDVESNAAVKLQIERAIESIESGSGGSNGGSTPANVANAKYYVSLSGVTNNTGRPTGEVQSLVHGAITSKLASLGGYQMAPSGESPDAARAVMQRRNLKGYYLSINVDRFDYSDGNLRVKIKLAVFSYPGKDLRGEVPAGATLPGARQGDKGQEDQLMRLVSESAAERFAQNFK